jgi:PAS domain S-box-containing protein
MGVLPRDEAIASLNAFHVRLEEAQRRGPARLEEAMSRSPADIGVHEIDANHVVTRVSPEELRLLGYTREQMIGRPVWEFIVMQEASQRAIDRKLKAEKEVKPFVRTFRRGDGPAIPMILVDRHLRDAQGRIVGMRTAMRETGPAE